MMSAHHHRARIRCPIRLNPFDITDTIRRFLSPPRRRRTPSPFSLTLKMVAAATTFNPKRPVCQSCSKPARTCLCGRIHSPGLDNSVAITILQHSLEKKHPLNSTRIVKLGFKNVTVATVSDVNFDARFSIWPLRQESEVGLAENGADCTDSSQYRELGFLHCLSSGTENVGKLVEDGEGMKQNCEDVVSEARDSKSLSDCTKSVIDIAMGKKGVIRSIEQPPLKVCIHQERPNFDNILESELAHGGLSKGFVVRKLQKRQVDKSLELEEFEEYKLTVPSGSVLLFPTEKALSIDELKESSFKVKNLIVLDGTWLKARRMYSENPWLRFLPHLKLDPQVMSLYREVRSQPKPGCLSTLESIVYALKALGDDSSGRSLDNLLEVFGSMVDDQRQCKKERLNKASTLG